MTADKFQIDKSKQAARERETDDDTELFKQRLKRAVKDRPVASKDAPLTGSSGKAELKVLRAGGES